MAWSLPGWFRTPRARTVFLAVAAAGIGAICLSYLQAEAELRLALEQIRSLQVASAVSGNLGWRLPDIPLVGRDGIVTTSDEVFGGGEGIVIFTVTCPHCRRQAPSWPRAQARLAADKGRLVLLSPDPHTETGPFLSRHGAGELEVFQVPETHDLYRLGAVAVPHFLRLDDRRDVSAQHGVPGPGSFNMSVELMDHFAPGLAPALRSEVARSLLGAEAQLGAVSYGAGGVVAARVEAGSRRYLLAMVPPSQGDAARAGAVVLLDSGGRVRRVLPTLWQLNELAAEPPRRELFDQVAGLGLEAALEESAARAREDTVAAPHWEALNGILNRLRGSGLAAPERD